MNHYYTSILILCWLALATQCVLVYENGRIQREGKRRFYMTYALIAASALSEWCGVWLNGRAELPDWMLRTAKCLDYILTPMAGGTLAIQMNLRNRWQMGINLILLANTVLQLASIPGESMVILDAQNHYTHGPLFPVYISFCLAMIVLVVIQFVLYGRTFKRQNRVSLYLSALLILAGFGIQELLKLRVAYLGMTLGTGLMFIHYSEYSQLAADDTMANQRVQLMLSQIKPHFLYNTLGSIEALCERDPKAAKLATRKFSKYLRGNMNALGGENLIPFDTELQHTRLYLELEQVRFGDALRVEYEIGAHDFFIPPLTLEPIVENAVQHGVRENPDGRGTVSICVRECDECYELRVTDDGPGFDPQAIPEDELHIGIRNVRERLAGICGAELSIAPGENRGAVVTIRLPKKGA